MAETTTHPNANNERRPSVIDSLRALILAGAGVGIPVIQETGPKTSATKTQEGALHEPNPGAGIRVVPESFTDTPQHDTPEGDAAILVAESAVWRHRQILAHNAGGDTLLAELERLQVPTHRIRAKLIGAAARLDREEQKKSSQEE